MLTYSEPVKEAGSFFCPLFSILRFFLYICKMKQEISEYYKKKGYDKLYVSITKEPRRVATIRKPDRETHSMSYAKYLYTSFYECDIPDGDQVDHINGDKMDDRIENLQVISGKYNALKDKRIKEMLEMVCPVCGTRFLSPKRNLSTHPNPCCSRHCGGIKSHWK